MSVLCDADLGRTRRHPPPAGSAPQDVSLRRTHGVTGRQSPAVDQSPALRADGVDQTRRCLDGGRHVRGDVGLMILRRKSSQLRTSDAPTLTHAPAPSSIPGAPGADSPGACRVSTDQCNQSAAECKGLLNRHRRTMLALASTLVLAASPAWPSMAASSCCASRHRAGGRSRSAFPRSTGPARSGARSTFPSCAMSGVGNSATHRWAGAPGTARRSTRACQSKANSAPSTRCDYSGAVSVTIDGEPWARTWWSLAGGTVAEYSATAKVQPRHLGHAVRRRLRRLVGVAAPPPPPCRVLLRHSADGCVPSSRSRLCAPPWIPSPTRALVAVESGFNPWAIGVVGGASSCASPGIRPRHWPPPRHCRDNWNFSVGLGPRSTSAASRRLGLTLETPSTPA